MIVDTGYSKVAISMGCFERFDIKENAEINFVLTSAVDTLSKMWKVFEKVIMCIRKSKVKIPAIILEGLHFDALLDVSWLTTVDVEVNIKYFKIKVSKESLPLKT